MFSFLKKNNLQESGAKQEVSFNDSQSEFTSLMMFIKQKTGIDLFGKQEISKQKISKFCIENHISSYSQLLSGIKTNEILLQQLYNLITVCETYFYREIKQLNYAIKYIKDLSLKKPVRVLCAPCSSGEEVYSLCIMSDISRIKNIQIIGIDINSDIIEKAKSGIYNERSLQSVPDDVKSIYFTKDDSFYRVKKDSFVYHDFKLVNVFDDKLFTLGSFDVIFSRNMMIYFNEDEKRLLVSRFAKLLNPDGLLFAGHADLVPQTEFFEKKFENQTNFYQKVFC